MTPFKFINKFLIFIVIIFTTIFINLTAQNNHNTIIKSRVIAEGIVTEIFGGGTQEIRNHSGYAIKDPVWIVAPPKTNTLIFLTTNIYPLNNFIDKKVHVEGGYIKVPGQKFSDVSFTASYDAIIVDTIYCIK